MFLRRLCLAQVFLFAMRGLCWCQCPKDAVPPDVVQFEDEVGARPLNIVVRELHLTGVMHATVEQQRQIAASVAGFCFPENKRDLIAERIRQNLQRLGFFKARTLAITIEAPDISVKPPTVSVIARVEDGERYRLQRIAFVGNRHLANSADLRRLFPIKDGDVFDPENIREGLEKMRSVYAEMGYINSTPVPDTKVDEENKLIVLIVDVDEGAPFFVESF